MQLKIVVYSKSACPHCDTVKSILKSKNLGFEEVKIDDEDQRKAFYDVRAVDAFDAPGVLQ